MRRRRLRWKPRHQMEPHAPDDKLWISCDSGDFLSIQRVDSSGGDILVVVEARCLGFTGRIDTWILKEAWRGFCDELGVLEGRRQGQAVVESISPREFRLTVGSIDSAGHMAIEGLLGYRGADGETLLTFSPRSFDPSSLPTLVARARAIASSPDDSGS